MDDTVNNGSLSTVVGDLYLYERGDECRLLFWYIMRLLVRLAPLGARQKKHPLCGCASKVIPKNSERDTIKVFKPIVKRKEKNMAQKAHSLSHTKWHCKYHIVFTPNHRRKVIYNQYRSSLGEIFHRLCSYKGVEIIEGHLMPDMYTC